MLQKLLIIFVALSFSLNAADTFTPYTADNVPQNVVDLWKDVDARKGALETEVVKEWREGGVVCRYVIFKIGTFKGADSRIAAFYTFPEGANKAPAFVWAHGGGQRAERERGVYFAKQGYATVDINWGGREMVEGIKANTDWGNVDPSQGPLFYPKAFRKSSKANFLPDQHTIDSMVSPRNGNWFLLSYAGRRAITFLEQQPEVDATKIGFTGYSMGGNITAYAAIDERLKAVVPMVGGASMITREFPGMPDTGRARGFGDHVELFRQTMESLAYNPHIQIPVLMLSASDDFHATFDNVFTCMAALPHDHWRASMKMHYSHNLDAEQWIVMNLWFDKYLKGEPVRIPETPASTLDVSQADMAIFSVTPDQVEKLDELKVYYSYDPNPQARYWKEAADLAKKDGMWTTTVPLHEGLPLFIFANCTYRLDAERESLEGSTSTFTLTSAEQVHQPAEFKFENLQALATSDEFTPSFSIGWAATQGGGLSTYKFRDPEMRLPGPDKALLLKLSGVQERYGVRLRITKNKYITGVNDPNEDFVFNVLTQPGDTEVIASLSDFLDSNKQPMGDWSNIATLRLDVIQQGKSLTLKDNPLIQSLDWTAVKPKP